MHTAHYVPRDPSPSGPRGASHGTERAIQAPAQIAKQQFARQAEGRFFCPSRQCAPRHDPDDRHPPGRAAVRGEPLFYS